VEGASTIRRQCSREAHLSTTLAVLDATNARPDVEVEHDGTFVIPKASDPAHARDNAQAGKLRLPAAELAKLEAVFPQGRPKTLPYL
jgi:aryl-alcohol dehydrogenase-like predicted oxidoreductase